MKKLFGALLALYTSVAFATTTVPVQLLNPTGSISGQAIVSTGASSAPAWGGIGVNGIAAIAANTVLANATGSSAAPTAFAMPSCTGTNNALQYVSNTGFACNGAINATQLLGSNWASPAAIGSTTPAAGSFTTISATGAITPSSTAGIIGVTTSAVANAGTVGEHNCVGAGPTSITSGTLTNIASVSLAAGEYQIGGNVAFNPAAGTTMTLTSGSTSTTSATNGLITNSLNLSFPIGLGQSYALVQQFYKFTTTTTVFLVAASTFSGGTNTSTASLCWLRIR